MARRVKSFAEEDDISTLDDTINAWIEVNVEGQGGGILGIQYQVVQENDQGRYTAMIFYVVPD